MGFQIKRGMVLRTTRTINVKDADGASHKLPAGTRVKAMATTEKGGVKVKIQDKAVPALRGIHIETGFSNVKVVDRGRPTDTPAPRATTKKASGDIKKPSAKKAAKAVEPAVDADVNPEPNGVPDGE